MMSDNRNENDLIKMKKKILWKEHKKNLNEAKVSTSPTGIPKFEFLANAYLAEIQRRTNRRTNIIMIICTVAITIMTALILGATFIIAFLAKGVV